MSNRWIAISAASVCLVAVLALTALSLAGSSAVASTQAIPSCCPDGPCCTPVSECCLVGEQGRNLAQASAKAASIPECCVAQAACCNPPSECCPASAKTALVPNCCAAQLPCCVAGAACCVK